MGLVERPVLTSSKGTFRMQLSASRPKIIVSADGTGIVSQTGGLLLTRALRVTGLDRGLEAALERWRPARAVRASMGQTREESEKTMASLIERRD